MEPDTNTKNEIRQITASNNKDNTHTIEGDDHQPLKTRSRKGIAKTFNRKTIEAIFPAKYIENGLNGTKAYQSIRPHSPSDSAKVEASRILTKPNVQQALQELLSENKLTVNETMKIHRRNLIQKEIFPYLKQQCKMCTRLPDS